MVGRVDAVLEGTSRRQLLSAAAVGAGVVMLPGCGLLTRPRRGLLVWLPGGSAVFCKTQAQLLAHHAASSAVLDGSELVCGIGLDTEYTQSLVASVMARDPPDISLLWDSPVSLGAQGAFLPLDAMMSGSKIAIETWPPGLMASCQFRNATYGLPLTAGVYTIWYNREMFEARGIRSDRNSFPKTWTELRRLSKEFTVWKGDHLQTAGFVPRWAPEAMAIWSALNGGMIYDAENQRYSLDSPQNLEMFHFFRDWMAEEYKGSWPLVERSGNFIDGYYNGKLGTSPAFQEGRLAGFQSGSWLMGDFYAGGVPEFERWDLAQHPVGPSGAAAVSGVWPNWMVIPRGAKNVREAFEYLSYMATEGVVTWCERVPDVPSNKRVRAKAPTIVVERRGAEFADDMTRFLVDQAKIVTPMWNSPVQSYANDQVTRAMELIYSGTASVGEALAQAQAACQAELHRVLAN